MEDNKKMKKERALAAINTARVFLEMQDAYTAYLLSNTNFVEKEAVGTAGVVVKDGKITIYYNSNFINSLSIEELNFVLSHEILHVVFQHHVRGRNKEKNIYNIVSDYVINNLLRDKLHLHVEGAIYELKIEKENLKHPLYLYYTADELYEFIKNESKNNDNEDNNKNNNNNKNNKNSRQIAGNHDIWEESDTDADESASVIEKMNDEFKRLHGGSSPVFEAVEFALNKAKANQTALKQLKNFLQNIILYEGEVSKEKLKSYKKLNKLNIIYKVPTRFPGWKEKYKSPEVNVILDVSGSLVDEYREPETFVHKALSTISSSGLLVNIYIFDVSYEKIAEKIPSQKLFNSLRYLKGGGGTDLNPLIEEIKKDKKLKRLPSVIITDGIMREVDFGELKVLVFYSEKPIPTRSKTVRQYKFTK